ncbi:FAD-binding oxidoreductase [Mycobacterium manitobense]|uniref:FAD-binding oxidoreductase n=1 Tax=[Mycobacterium] manitobense TaxID=190147 RepID=A0A9X2Y9F8_9MYCO|nr:FAD-binding oxidoreductase [[Mycobacterium] manitobense]MCV7170407.1 FAD-binding oxidoreductase [[Mycobacterium] manitobense]
MSAVDFAGLRARLTGELAEPGDPSYDVARPWNSAVVGRPAGVVIAADANDVRTTVRWAGSHGLRVAVHATGHGTVSQGDDVVIVHTGRLQQCTVDPGRRAARVGAGVATRRLLDAAHAYSLAAVTGATGTVGVVGHLSGGGVGPLAATLGAASDHVLALEVVTGDGILRRATAEENPDLFWAMRGSKAAIGVITAAELRLCDVWGIYGGALYFTADHAPRVLRHWARWSAGLPDAYTTSLSLTNVPDLPHVPAAIAGRYVAVLKIATPAGRDVGADRDRTEARLATVRQVAPAVLDSVGVIPYRDITAVLGDAASPAPVHQDHVLLDALPPESVDAILGAAGPGSGSRLTTVEIRRLGGKLARPSGHAGAFSRRNSPYSLGITTILDGSAPSIVATADRLIAAVGPWTASGVLANFIDTTDPVRITSAYDRATLLRLRRMAEKYDSGGVFGAPGEVPLRREDRAGH